MAYTSSQVVQAVPTGINSALVFISSGTVTAGATVSILNAFSTTYDFYSMRFSNFQMQNDNVTITLQLGTSGTAYTGTDYYSRGYSNGGGLSAVSEVNVSSFTVATTLGTTRNGLFLELASPFLSSSTHFTSTGQGNYSANFYASQISGVLKTNTSYTDMFFASNSGNVGPFTYALYGYTKS